MIVSVSSASGSSATCDRAGVADLLGKASPIGRRRGSSASSSTCAGSSALTAEVFDARSFADDAVAVSSGSWPPARLATGAPP